MRILLATDGSPYSEAAVDELASRPMPIDSQVLVISVVELPSFPWAFPGGGVDFDQQGRPARIYLINENDAVLDAFRDRLKEYKK